MGKKLIYDSWGDVVSVVQHDEMAKTTTFAQFQDTAPYFEANRKAQTANDGYSPSRELRRIASIPNVILVQWLREAGIPVGLFLRTWKKNPEYKRWLFKKIYDPDNRDVLTAPRWSNRYVPAPKVIH